MEVTFEAGASVAMVAWADGANANRVFTERWAFWRGELVEPAVDFWDLLLAAPLDEGLSDEGSWLAACGECRKGQEPFLRG